MKPCLESRRTRPASRQPARSATARISALALAALALGILLGPARHASACGPFFPNMLLDAGDRPLLVAPLLDFLLEMERLHPGVCRFQARIPTNGHVRQTADADVADLRHALEQGPLPPARRGSVLEQYQAARAVLADHAEALEAWRRQQPVSLAAGLTNPPPRLQAPPPIEGLPAEFADYLRGAIAWHAGRTNDARAAWQALLQRPAAERPFKSTWAAFMIGKSWPDSNPDAAIRAFREVRALARAGFADSPGLAASSLGWEARVDFHRQRYEPAIELYLEQLAAGDESAEISLRWVAAAALRDRKAPLRKLAANDRCRRVLTAWLLAGGHQYGPVDMDGPTKEALLGLMARAPWVGPRVNGLHRLEDPAVLWLEAVEAAGIRDAEAAERFALAAYQSGRMDTARRWIARATNSPVAQWLHAKLLLRDGQLDRAAAWLAHVCRQLPLSGDPIPTSLDRSLYLPNGEYSPRIRVASQALGELGALRLARREFVEALDCLVRSDFWIDAAYVAERVLTLDELKSYVDAQWPPATGGPIRDARSEFPPDVHPSAPIYLEPLGPGGRLRHLLGRRLLRSGRGTEVRPYFPAGLQPAVDTYLAGLAAGTNLALAADRRAAGLWTSAQLARRLGLELLGTEVEPDWAVHGGNFEEGPATSTRQDTGAVARATSEELQRARRHTAPPDVRYHYRYTAAGLAWDAARLMPDNADDTARVLCRAGIWLKGIDPGEADRFYKALVRRCRRTDLGQAADRRRWFPDLDETGNLIPPTPAAPDAGAEPQP